MQLHPSWSVWSWWVPPLASPAGAAFAPQENEFLFTVCAFSQKLLLYRWMAFKLRLIVQGILGFKSAVLGKIKNKKRDSFCEGAGSVVLPCPIPNEHMHSASFGPRICSPMDGKGFGFKSDLKKPFCLGLPVLKHFLYLTVVTYFNWFNCSDNIIRW